MPRCLPARLLTLSLLLCSSLLFAPAVLAQGDGASREEETEPIAATNASGAFRMQVEIPFGTARQESVNHLVVLLENAGPDFTGTLILSTVSWIPHTQYFQQVELASGTTKRFTFNAFEGTQPSFQAILLDSHGNEVLRQPVTPVASASSDVQMVQLGGHRSDFAALQGDSLALRMSIADLIDDVGAIKNSFALSAMQMQEPDIPLLAYRYLPPEALPAQLLDLLGLNLIAIDLGQWQRLAPVQQELLTSYVRFGGRLLLYPALDYGYPNQSLEHPLLPVPLEVGFDPASPAEMNGMKAFFPEWRGSLDRPLRFLRPARPPANAELMVSRLSLPGGRTLLLSRPEGYGRVALLTMQPALFSDGAGGDRYLLQLLDRTGLLESSGVQFYRSGTGGFSMGSGAVRPRGRFWRAATPRFNFWLANYAQAMNPGSFRPFRGTQSTFRLTAVPLAFLQQEGWKLLIWGVLVAGVMQLIVTVRRRIPLVWLALPLVAALFVLTFTPVAVQIETPYRYEAWNILRFPGTGSQAFLASASWVANLSRHGTPQVLTSTQSDFFFDEFVYRDEPLFRPATPVDYPTVQHRQGAAPAIVQLQPHLLGDPRLLLGWGPVTTDGQLSGVMRVNGPDERVQLILTNDTPWPVRGGLLLLESEYLYIEGAAVPAVPAGDSITITLDPKAVTYRLDQTTKRHMPTPIFDLPIRDLPQILRGWAYEQSQVLYEEVRLQQDLEFTKPTPEHTFLPTEALFVGELEGGVLPLELDGRTPEGRRFTLATCPVRIEWSPTFGLRQPPFTWEYYPGGAANVLERFPAARQE